MSPKYKPLGTIFLLMASMLISSVAADENPPPLDREFRAAWVATVANIDWPSKPGLTVADQKSEMLKLLDVAAELNFNAIILQVRPAADAIYPSKLEPWSEYITGQMGKSPGEEFDPLAFAIVHAHRRGMELHAWFNPYRARHKSSKDKPVSADHISRTRPDLVREYDGYLWLDPGEPDGVKHSLAVIMDVVKRYDVDGVHFDDYFYPYPVKDENGNKIPFPDDASWQKREDKDSGLSRDDWRRANVDRLISQIYTGVKKIRPSVKVGISPFGIWRPGHPESVTGFDAYAELYADARKWLQEGWVDYMTPQLYWKIDSKGQSYPKLLQWWHEQNTNVTTRHLWPGNYASRLGFDGDGRWPTEELIDQIKLTRNHTGATGNVHFSMKTFTLDYGGINEDIRKAYAQPAIIPACPWLDNRKPKPTSASAREENGQWMLAIESVEINAEIGNFALQWQKDGKWRTKILSSVPDTKREYFIPAMDRAFVTAISNTGVAGDPAAVEF